MAEAEAEEAEEERRVGHQTHAPCGVSPRARNALSLSACRPCLLESEVARQLQGRLSTPNSSNVSCVFTFGQVHSARAPPAAPSASARLYNFHMYTLLVPV